MSLISQKAWRWLIHRRYLYTQLPLCVSDRLSEYYEKESRDTVLVTLKEASRFINETLMRVGVPLAKSLCIADCMLAADHRGVFGCGMYRLDTYVHEIYQKHVNIDAEPQIMFHNTSIAHVNGNNTAGILVGNFCMDLAIRKAKKSGIGLVLARDSNYYGMGAWYVYKALRHEYVGIVMSNTAPLLVAPRAVEPHIGANCLSFGAKGLDNHVMLDMACSVKDFGSIEFAFMKNEHIPLTWAADDCGRPTRFPSSAVQTQVLFPAGGHKGYCLAALIDLLCGVLSGANYGTAIPRLQMPYQKAGPNIGQVYIAIDPGFFVPNFANRVEDFIKRIQKCARVDPKEPVMVPGDPERYFMSYVDSLHAIPYPAQLLDRLDPVAKMLCVEPIHTGYF